LNEKLEANKMTGVITDKRAQMIGGVQQFAYTAGTQAGLSKGAGAEEDIKLMTKFGQTQQDVYDLFDRIMQEASKAGISVTKYLEIVEGITDGFDRFHKTLTAVTDTMRVLGSTGIATSEDLKDTMELYLKGPDKTLEQMMTVIQMIPKQEMIDIANAGEKYAKSLRDSASTALTNQAGMSGFNLNTTGGILAAQQDLATKNIDEGTKQTLGATLTNLLKTQKDLSNTMDYLKDADLAKFAGNMKNMTGFFKQMMNARAFQTATGRAGVSNEQGAERGYGALAPMIAQVLGLDPNDLDKYSQRNIETSMSYMNTLQKQPGVFHGGELKTLYGAASGAGLAPAADQNTTEKMMQDALNKIALGPHAGELGKLITNSNSLQNMVNDNMSAMTDTFKQIDQSAKKARPTAEDIQSNLVSAQDALKDATIKLEGRIGQVYTWLTDHFGVGGGLTPTQAAVQSGTATPQQLADQAQDQMKIDFWSGQGDRWELFKKLMSGNVPQASDFPVAKAAGAGAGTNPVNPTQQAPAAAGSTHTSYTTITGDASVHPGAAATANTAQHETAGKGK
jgi:hypothetical protein